jgi:hypothetical protein
MLGILSTACQRQTFIDSNEILRKGCMLHIMETEVPRKGVLLHSKLLHPCLP